MVIPLHQLWEACKQGDLTAVQGLAQAGADIHEREELAFRWACARGHMHVAQWLVAQGGVDIHAQGDDGFLSACAYGELAVGQWLVAQGGVDIHVLKDYAFVWASARGHLAVARWLVRQDPQYEGWPLGAMLRLRAWSRARSGWMRSVVGIVVARA